MQWGISKSGKALAHTLLKEWTGWQGLRKTFKENSFEGYHDELSAQVHCSKIVGC